MASSYLLTVQQCVFSPHSILCPVTSNWPKFDGMNVSTDPRPESVTSTVRPQHDPHGHLRTVTQQPGSTAVHTSPTHTDISEPRTDVTIVHDPFGRVIRPGVHSHRMAASAAAA